METCVFCKVVAGELPKTQVCESENFIVIQNITPKVSGHSLVIPKKHYETFNDIPQELYEEFMKTTKKAINKLLEENNAEGYNIGMNNGKTAGQSVYHAHLHILPRTKGDGQPAIGG